VGWAIAAEQVNAVLKPTHHVLRTEDGGESWWEVTPPEEVAPSNSVRLVAVGFFLDAQHAWVTLGNDSLKRPIIWHTADGGLSWEAATISTRGGRYPSNPTFDFPDPDHGWLLLDSATGASSSEQDVLRTADGGRTWENMLQQGYGMGPITGIDFRDSQTGWVTNSHGLGFFPSTWITRTSDGGVRWAETVPASMEDPNAVLGRDCLLSQPMSENALRGRALWTCSTGENPPVEFYLGWTEDGGTSWKHVRIPGTPYSLGKIGGWALGLAEPDSSDGMASVLYRTSSGGLEWYEVSRLPWFGALDFATGQDGWAIDDGGLLRTRDGGKTWVSLDARLVAPPGMPSDTTAWVDPSWSLSKISSANASDVLQLSEFHAPSPVSLVAGRSAVYVGLTNGRVAVWDWTDPESVPATLPLLRISDFPIYDLDAPQEALGFAAASLDGHAYSYEAWQWFELDILPSPDGEISGVAASIHGIFTSGEDGIVRLWERAEAAEGAWEIQQEHPGHIGWAWDVDTSPQGEFVASGGSDRTVRLGSAADDEPWKILEGHTSVVTKVRFPFHAVQLAAASRDGSIRVWDTFSGESLFVLLGHKDWVMDLVYSPDDTLLASADASGEVILWDVAGRKELFRWQAHQGAARAVAFLPDGRILLTAGDDGTVRIWGIQP